MSEREEEYMEYVLIGMAVSVGWHIVKLLYHLIEEVVFNRLHATEWYAILCKKQSIPMVPVKLNTKKSEDYKETKMGFRRVA